MVKRHSAAVFGLLLLAGIVSAQQPDAKQVAQERKQAELDVPKLVEALELKPGMSVADVGAGGGSMSVVLARWIGTGRVFATDLPAATLARLRETMEKEGLANVTVLEGAAGSTNLPAECCDAIFLRSVYHHITQVEPFNKSLIASLKPGGRLAIIDFVPQPKSTVPEGVPANRGGHGITPALVRDELVAAGLTHVKTIERWPEERSTASFLVLFRKE